MILNQDQENALNQANRNAIQRAIPRLQAHWGDSTWLVARNRYRVDTIGKIQEDSKNGCDFKHQHLIDYVAASTITHCFDGWSYLARALEAEMAGDPNAARHLGYFAELRAAMSILAGEGVGIFHRNHVVITDSDRCIPLGGLSTHAMAWQALKYRAGLNQSDKLIFRAIKPGGFDLQAWLNYFGGSAGFVAKKWLKEWGLDLSRLSEDDKKSRDLASYRPTAFTSSGTRGAGETVQAITQFWRMCNPGSEGGFPVIDRHLLRLSLGMLFKHRTEGRSPLQARKKYSEQISTMLDNFSFTEAGRLRWESFLRYETEKELSPLFLDAGRGDKSTHIDHSKQVLARATLLLRVATGLLSDLFHESNSEIYSDLRFWWVASSVRRCSWAIDNPPDSFIDLWEDVAEALEEVHEWIRQTGQPECHYSFWKQNHHVAMTLTASERIFLWGV